MSDTATTFTSFKCFLSYLRSYLSGIRSAKAVFIGDDFVRSAFAELMSDKATYVGAKLSETNC